MTIVNHTNTLMGEDDYDRVFSVFDRDSHSNFDKAVRHIADSDRGKAGTWHAVTSIPCFEVWLMLHYEYSTAPIVESGGKSPGEKAVDALKKFQPHYAKGAKDIYASVHDMTETAIQNAIKLQRHNSDSSSSNPATNMHMLVDYLRKLKA